MQKSNRLAAGETKLCTWKDKSWIPAFAGMTSKEGRKKETRHRPIPTLPLKGRAKAPQAKKLSAASES
jgi:hypothetical protein